ncbi:5'-deoxynucleotidase HDDC2 [Drosophila santomea]|uniref:5'-deoxynucleotidase HDDC2 n=1 Tax=Drosophila santomea TaxID=129105 RepID=UPI0019535A17|nr:5'-deoxynucleotidase HDDC2 [Drosophila santomea]XP_039493851.1 5'-deoxynucleotidase HDDC2 [Drosophila santomea]XP_039493859.1 5'-deoxynucleotidase HDDC2 [Drosophila santomea]XP_039493867.1 5'-deoxynucleotidase HDDC2 [Drosophila santomea]
MFSLQQLLRATATSNGGNDLSRLLRHMGGVTSGATTTLCTASATKHSSQAKFGDNSSHGSPSHTDGRSHGESESDLESAHGQNFTAHHFARRILQQRSQDIQRHIHTQSSKGQTRAKSSQQQQQQQTATKFAMSSLAAEPLQSQKPDEITASTGGDVEAPGLGASCHEVASASASAGKKPCFSSGLGEILQFMELIGNLKHTKRTGWVLRDVNDCESISGHMYRMSMLTFLLDGSEGLNQIRCMELALVHDLAESLVGDITPFCGISKDDKRAMEFKAMEDICKLIEPRGKRIMELFEEYEHGQTAESKFVKDLDRLDMVMQAFEYEKRDNCLLKHQEFFDSTEGKFNHPFVKKLVNEIYEQRDVLAKAKGATPPPTIEVPSMERSSKLANGHDGSS